MEKKIITLARLRTRSFSAGLDEVLLLALCFAGIS